MKTIDLLRCDDPECPGIESVQHHCPRCIIKALSTDPLSETCPQCGEPTESGFGLAGGGYGEYVFCECGFFSKVQV